MNEKTNQSGWSIKQGDYLRDTEHDEQFLKLTGKNPFKQSTYSHISSYILGALYLVLLIALIEIAK